MGFEHAILVTAILLIALDMRRRWRGVKLVLIQARGKTAVDIENALDHVPDGQFAIIIGAHPAALAAVSMTRSRFDWTLAGSFAFHRRDARILAFNGVFVETHDFILDTTRPAILIDVFGYKWPAWTIVNGPYLIHARLFPWFR
jgi:hypothetical protein